MKARLICRDAVASINVLEWTSNPVTVGRGPQADLCLNDCWASRIHCRFEWVEGDLIIQDLQSSHGTLVNGEPVEKACLHLGDQVTIGITTFEVMVLNPPREHRKFKRDRHRISKDSSSILSRKSTLT